MKSFTYFGPDGQVVPEMLAPDGSGTLVLHPGEMYQFDDDPPGDPAWWALTTKKAAAAAQAAKPEESTDTGG